MLCGNHLKSLRLGYNSSRNNATSSSFFLRFIVLLLLLLLLLLFVIRLLKVVWAYVWGCKVEWLHNDNKLSLACSGNMLACAHQIGEIPPTGESTFALITQGIILKNCASYRSQICLTYPLGLERNWRFCDQVGKIKQIEILVFSKIRSLKSFDSLLKFWRQTLALFLELIVEIRSTTNNSELSDALLERTEVSLFFHFAFDFPWNVPLLLRLVPPFPDLTVAMLSHHLVGS